MNPAGIDPAHDLQAIRAMRQVNERLACSGQPTEAQLATIAAAGYQVVINLGLHEDKRYALPDEAASVAALGLGYVHIPVPFGAPQREHLLRCFDALDAHLERKVWLHCAANFRATAFLGLYRSLRQGLPRDEAFATMDSVWQPDATWQRFIDEQLMAGYYARRAAEYEAIYHKPERQAGLRRMEAELPACFEGRRVLEIACGTGWWTPHGAARAQRWLATDLNPETMAVARSKPLPACVELRSMDAFNFDSLAGERFDAAFAGCWWSHLPLAGCEAWLAALHAQLEPGARVVMIDNRYVEGSSTPISRRDAEGNTYQQRHLADGSTHEVLKNFPSEAELRERIGKRAASFAWTDYPHYWRLDYTLADTVG